MKAKTWRAVAAGLLSYAAFTALPCLSQTLIGGVTVNDSLPSVNSPEGKKLSSMSDAKYDSATVVRPKGDCICFDRNRVEAKEVGGIWKIVDGDHWILDFANNQANAQLSAKTIREYKMNEICFVGRNTGRPMMFFLSDGNAPQGKIEGEDAVPIDPNLVKAEEINGSWKLTCGSLWMEDFGKNGEPAKVAAAQIKHYGFTRQCYIGRPAATMEYFAK